MHQGDSKPLKDLMGLLGQQPRLNLIKAVAEGGGSPEVLARRIDMLPYEITEHLQLLHEYGVVALEDEEYSLSPRVHIATTDTQHILRFQLADADTAMTLTLNRQID